MVDIIELEAHHAFDTVFGFGRGPLTLAQALNLEHKISKSPKWAYFYALEVVRGRFYQAERTIATDPEYAFWYAVNVLQDRFYEGEPTIYRNRRFAEEYVHVFGDIRSQPFDEIDHRRTIDAIRSIFSKMFKTKKEKVNWSKEGF